MSLLYAGKTALFTLLAFLMTADISQAEMQVAAEDRTGISEGPDSLVFKNTDMVAANPDYAAGEIRGFLLGRRYRNAWTEPIEAPTLDLDETAGGLTVTGSAGGQQSTILFLSGEDGREYVMRTIDKDPGAALPAGTQNTIVEDVARDQTSSLHPYGAFIVPELARPAGLLHTHPVLVLVPDSPKLGEHRDTFSGKLALIERNVTGDVSDAERFGYAEEMIDTETLIDRLESGPSHFVDERAYLKTRLFDMLIGDRDRHEGQYFWAVFGENERTRYVPVPIDRDFAFARFDGFLPRIGRMTGMRELRKMTNFDEDIENLIGLNYQGAKLDYRFTSSLEREDWLETARELQDQITDDVIEGAVGLWPNSIVGALGTVTITDLQMRRDGLDEAAGEYYELMARRVDVIGTDAPERFAIHTSGRDSVEVVVTALNRHVSNGAVADAGSPHVYRRTFDEDATEEIRLYGQGGDDQFVVRGEGKGGIIIRVIGGDGSDTFRNGSPADEKLIHFYDTWMDENEIDGHAYVERLPDVASNKYQMHRYELNSAAPLLSFDYDSDQGVFLGGGVRMVRYGFRKEPYAARHLLTADYAPRSKGYNIRYEGHLVHMWKRWDAVLDAELLAEDVFRDFYGLGNETPESNRALFDARFRWITVFPALKKTFGPFVSLRLGPEFEVAQIRPPEGLTAGDPEVGYTTDQLTDRYVGGVTAQLDVDSRDSTMIPRTGIRWFTEAGVHQGFESDDVRFARLASRLSAYRGIGPFTLALRVGGATNFGDFAFYQANYLGGDTNLRGYTDHRFAGRTSAYGNAELRLELTEFNVYLTRGHLGILGFTDVGRVWADGEKSDVWHQGYGGGVWITPFNRLVVTGTLGYSEAGSIFDLSFDLFF